MVKWSRYRPGVTQRVGRVIALLFHDRGTRRGWVVSSTLRPHFTPGKTRYPFYRRLGGPQGQSGRAENLVPTEIRYRTVQPVVSRYTIPYYPAYIIFYYNIIVLWDHRCICGPSLTETSFCGAYLYMYRVAKKSLDAQNNTLNIECQVPFVPLCIM